MRAWLREQVLAFLDALSRIRRQFLTAILNVLVIGVALSLPVGLYVVLNNVSGLIQRGTTEPQLTLFLDTAATQADTDAIRQRLKESPDVQGFEFVPKDKALAQLQSSSGLADVREELGENPLPDAFIVSGRATRATALEKLRDETAKWPHVELAQLDSVWARQLEAGIRVGKAFVAMLAIVLGVALVAVTFNTIRLQILGRREEIEVSKLIGATNSFIRRPFLYFGALQGVLGALFSWGLVSLALALLERQLGVAISALSDSGQLRGLSGAEVLSVGAVAAGLGWMGAWISVSSHLRRLDPD
ncbi:MAG: FtsX-like permease family protein [Betaproteobacteria bacterium]|nr:FtsX-like permease family protein [Betaproteobacteria bacterium]